MAEVEKPRVRRPAGSSRTFEPFATADSFTNFQAKLGIRADNLSSGGTYTFNFLTRDRSRLEAMYRGSWLVGAAVDIPAEDMTRGGLEFVGTLSPEDKDKLNATLRDANVWQQLADAIRWGRLYGGCIAVPMIDGQNMATELRVDTVGEGGFLGIMVLDRWTCVPSTELVQKMGPYFGLPDHYTVMAGAGIPAMRIHHTRALRFIGTPLPFWQLPTEMYWGASVMERLLDRLLAFDSTTQGAAQLVYKAHLRTIKVEGLRNLIAAGGKMLDALLQNFELIRRFQGIEGITLLDAADQFETHQYTFSGLNDVLEQLGLQLGGALEIPLVRLFGDSPSGLNSSGESELRTYYDGVVKRQEKDLRRPMTVIMDIIARSTLKRPLGDGFTFNFRPLWQMTPEEAAKVALARTQTIMATEAVVSPQVILKELRALAALVGIFGNISDKDINSAEDEPPPPPPPPGEATPGGGGDKPKPTESPESRE